MNHINFSLLDFIEKLFTNHKQNDREGRKKFPHGWKLFREL